MGDFLNTTTTMMIVIFNVEHHKILNASFMVFPFMNIQELKLSLQCHCFKS